MAAGTQLAERERGTGGGKPRVCVIGAGSSGIASRQVLHARGIPFDCFEQRYVRSPRRTIQVDFYPYMRTLRRERRRGRGGGLAGLLARRSHELRLGSPSR